MEYLYEKTVELITSRDKFHICLGLERVEAILEKLGNPQDSLRVIHVAGTNGKGSTCALLSKILTSAGYKTGLYTSPHILKYTERIKINQVNITEKDFSELIFEINSLAKKYEIYLTEFELLTVCAYKYFSQKEVDICIIETGLGGRLDATNIIKQNIASVITSISLDHVDRLGYTVDKIAYEKAGIIKPEAPVIVAHDNVGFNIICETACKISSNVIVVDDNIELMYTDGLNYACYKNHKYEFNMLGVWQKKNLNLVFACIEYLKQIGYQISEESISRALKNIFWPCRMQYLAKQNILLDGTHNPDGAKVLKESLDYYFPNRKRVWIYGAINTKDYTNVCKTLFEPNDEVYFYVFDYPNAVPFEELRPVHEKALPVNIRDLDYLLHENRESLIILSGSFYMLGQILEKSCFFQNIAEVVNIM